MPDVFTAIQDLPSAPLPRDLEKKTLNKVLILKLRPYLYSFAVALCANFIWLSLHIYKYLVASSALSVIKVMWEDFDLSSDYILNSLAGLKEVLPLYKVSMLSLNLLLLIYLVALFRHYRHELLKFNNN